MVEIYSTPTCPFCVMAKDYFNQQGVEYVDYNVAEDQEKASEMVQKSGQMGVPVIVIDDNIIIGFDKPRIEEILENRSK